MVEVLVRVSPCQMNLIVCLSVKDIYIFYKWFLRHKLRTSYMTNVLTSFIAPPLARVSAGSHYNLTLAIKVGLVPLQAYHVEGKISTSLELISWRRCLST